MSNTRLYLGAIVSTGIDFIKICSSIIQPSNNEAATPATVNLFLNSFSEEVGVLLEKFFNSLLINCDIGKQHVMT